LNDDKPTAINKRFFNVWKANKYHHHHYHNDNRVLTAEAAGDQELVGQFLYLEGNLLLFSLIL
jgi:hypothetical protein